ncbi:MAG: DNA polymerase II large subunit [Nanoarchaeota archaeon]
MQTDAQTQKYFDSIQKEVDNAYSIATAARAKGKDPETTVEILLAEDLAARVEGLVSTFFPTLFGSGLKEGIRVLEGKYGKNDERVALLIGRNVAIGKYGDFGTAEKFAEVGLRIAVAYLTLGVVTAPLEGISKVLIKKNDDGTDYLAVYYAGPIRSAGGTASAVSVLAADFIRKALKIGAYKPTEAEINRYFVEVEDYYTRVTAKQYHPTKEEMTAIIKNVPVEITGDPTEELEVSTCKDLPRVETNKIRGGMCLILLDGIPLKAEKVLGRVKKYPEEYDLKNWLWLADFVKLKNSIHAAKKVELKDNPNAAKYTPKDTYLSKVLAGRPIFSHPSKRGGFRLRYGRSRTGGLAATSLHPATMWLTEFIAVGTQLATEFPGKATVCAPCDTIDPPIVKLRNGTILELRTREEVKQHKTSVESILSLGDIVVPYGEFVSNNHMLMPSAYCKEWWLLELKKAISEKNSEYSYEKYALKPPTISEAFDIARELGIPLHPEYNFFWHDLSIGELKELIQWFSTATIENDAEGERAALAKAESFRILEILCTPCTVKDEKVILSGKSLGAYYSLGKPTKENVADILASIAQETSAMSAVSKLAGIRVRERGLTRIGIRMGRPEKAEKRLLKGKPQILFPCGIEGGKMRNLMEAYSSGKVTAEFPVFKCTSCGAENVFSMCPKCNVRGTPRNICQSCNSIVEATMHCNQPTKKYRKMTIKLKELLDEAFKNISVVQLPKLFKGVRGVSGPERSMEYLEKGVLRTKYELYVNKDGTTRYDASDISMTHFKPSELGVSVAKLKSIGYVNDYLGRPLENENQILELSVQDIVISDNEEFSSVNYMLNVSRFIDELLVKFYSLPPYYNMNSREDLVGQLVVGLAPHTSAGIVGRIVGFTRSKVCYAHPFWHAGKRRNCFFGNEKIIVHDGKEFRLSTIRELVETNLTDGVETDAFGTEYKTIAGLKTFAFNKLTKKFELSDMTHVSKHPAPQILLEIKTKCGRKIVVTPDHLLLNKCGEKIRAEDATEVLIPWQIENPITSEVEKIDLLDVVNNRNVMVRTEEQIFGNGTILSQISANLGMNYKTLTNYVYRKFYPLDIVEHFSQNLFENKKYFLGSKRDSISIKPEILLNEDFLCILGFYLAEGYTKKNQKNTHQISITATKARVKAYLETKIKDVFGLTPNTSGNAVTICSRFVYELFNYLEVGKDARSKRVPNFVYSLPKEKLAALLRGYFSGDGSCAIQSTLEVNVTSVNKWLIDSVSVILMFLGIKHSIYEENREIKSELILKFYGKPKFLHSYKIRLYGDDARKYIETIGFVEDKQVRAKALLEQWLTKKGTARAVLEGDSFVDKIVGKKFIENREKYVYDVTVDMHHNLICSGIVAGNCDGDEDSIMLLMDALLNFSRKFLPDTRGGRTMDAPLVLTSKLNPEEVDDEAWRVDISSEYPLEFYEDTMNYKTISELTKKPRLVADVIKTSEVFHIKFTHGTADVNDAPIKTKYVELGSMKDKVTAQLGLAEKIVAVNKDSVAELVISKHFLRDIKGNLRTFSEQKVRCATCNAKYRRVPLIGKCYCGGKLMLSVSEGAIRKYVEPTKHIIEKYKISPYLFQQFSLLEKDIDSLFGKKARQLGLERFNAK